MGTSVCDLSDLPIDQCACNSCRPDLKEKPEEPFDPAKMVENYYGQE